jgi:crossover junction endodeoxyribonuclease RuvC
MFAFGRGVGQIEGTLATLQIPISYATPAKWKRALAVPAGKHGAGLRASELLPGYAERWRRAKDHGRPEAALLALYGLTHLASLMPGASFRNEHLCGHLMKQKEMIS